MREYKTNLFGGKIFLIIIPIVMVIAIIGIILGSGEGLNLFATVMSMDQSQAEEAKAIFDACGIKKITSIEKFKEGEDETSYYIEDEETSFYKGAENKVVIWINNETKEISSIYYRDKDIYRDGEVKSQVTDYYVNANDRDNYRVSTQVLVQNVLNNPSTAKFPSISGWKFGIEKGVIIIQSSVTSKNDFGVEKTYDFQVKYKNNKPTSLIVGGKEYIK